MDLNDDSRQWDYSDAAQRILIAERCRAMLDALAFNTPAWDDVTPDATRENLALEFANLTNAKGSVESALRRMRVPASPEPAPTFRRGIYTGEQSASTDDPAYLDKLTEHARKFKADLAADSVLGDTALASTATALHSCQACGRHPDTHKRAEDDNCAMCGMGEEK